MIGRSPLMAYGVALAATAVAVTVRVLLDPWLGSNIPFATLFAAVAFAAWFGGRGPAILSMVAGALAMDYFIFEPRFSFKVSGPQFQFGFIVYFAVGLSFIFMFESLRKVMSSAQKQSELLRLTLASIGDAVITTDAKALVSGMNPVAEAMTGWTAREAEGQPLEKIFQIVNEDTRETVESPVTRALRDGVIVGLANHTVLITKGGEDVYIDDSAAPIKDAEHNAVGAILVFHDISERRRLEKRASEQFATARLLASIVESSDDAIVRMSLDGTIESWNQAAERLYGYSAQEVLGRLVTFLIPPELKGEEDGILESIQAGKRVEHYETTRVRKDGRVVPVSLTVSPLMDESGRVVGASKIARDITVRREAEEVLAKGERELSEFFENAAMGLHWVGPDGTILRVNQTELDLLGYSRDEYVGHNIAEFHADQAIIDDILERLSRGETLTDYHAPLRCKDGSIRHVVIYSNVRWENEEFVHTRCFTRDITEQRLAELARRESDERLAGAFQAALDCIITIDHESIITEFNAAAERTFGFRREDVVGRELAETIIPEEFRQQHWDGLARFMATGEGQILDQRIELPALHADGRTFPIELSVTRVKSVEPPVFTAFLRDISDRKEAEEALRASEERLRLSLDAGSMGVWDWNIRTGELNWSDTLEPLHGLQPGTFGGTFEAFQELVHPEDRLSLSDAIRIALENSSDFEIEFRVVWPNGSIRWIAGKGGVFPGLDGQPLRMIGVGLDVTKRKRSQQTAQFLADASAELAVLVDFESTLQKVATMAVPYFADWAAVDILDGSDILRRVAVAHVDPSKVELALEVQRRFPSDPTAETGAWKIIRTGQPERVAEITDELLTESIKDKELLDIIRELGLQSYIGVPLMVGGRITGVLTFISAESGHLYDDYDMAIARDLAHRTGIAIQNLQLYQELQQADRRKDEFLATLAHELRNPLAPIRSGLDFMRMTNFVPEAVEETTAIIERQMKHLVRLVDDLMDVSRINSGKLVLQKERVSLASVVDSALESSRPLIQEMGHTLTVNLPEEELMMSVDLTRLAQVFSNLLNNAAKYTERGGHITLTAQSKENLAVVSVKDTGIGIAADQLSGVFDMFSQVAGSLQKAQGGLGIGLMLVQSLVELHGGSIIVRSEGLGKGSEFIVQLPLVESNPLPGTTDLKRTDSLTSARILVVDDNADVAYVLKRLLETSGNKTHAVHSGEEAVAAAAEFKPGVILLDIGLPQMDGYEACRQIRAQPGGQDILIIAQSGWGSPDDRRQSNEAGFDHHLVKPVELKALVELINNSAKV